MLMVDDYFQGHGLHQGWDYRKSFPQEFTQTLFENATKTVDAANALLDAFGQQRGINSGWRPASINASTPGAAVFSRHLTGEAIDLYDPEGDLDEWCLENPDVLERLNLYQEHPATTKGWCHVQTVPPKSGKRVFYP